MHRDQGFGGGHGTLTDLLIKFQRALDMPKTSFSPTFALVVSRFNSEITQKLHEGAYAELIRSDISPEHIHTFWVPGAVEIPIVAKRCAQSGRFSAIITLGAVIRGDTGHYEFVCQQVSYGCQKVSLKHDIPVIFGVLTTDNEQQALDRVGGAEGHKGIDAARAALDLLNVLSDSVLCIR